MSYHKSQHSDYLDDFSDDTGYYAASLSLFRGMEVQANYIEQHVPSYKDNPLIEALPLEYKDDYSVLKALRQVPDFSPDVRMWPVRERMHAIGDLEDHFFQPLSSHLSLQFKISRMIRRGYVFRNPKSHGYYQTLQKEIADFDSSEISDKVKSTVIQRPKAYGFALIGPSGIGKTYSLESILSLFPQVINHTNHKNKAFPYRQLVWLKLDCPFDGSLKGLTLDFFEAVDIILGTHYQQNYAESSRVSVDDLVRAMARVAALHSLGALVIDEIQMLRGMRAQYSARMLNFFVNLANKIGVPVLLVGTDKARMLFEQRPAQARRSTGQGAEVWRLMQKDQQWEIFLRSLFKYQYVRKPIQLTEEISNAFFNETQGITDLVVKLFVQCQIRAMITEKENAEEMISVDVIRSVALDSFQMLHPVISALRKGDKAALARLEDIYPFWREEYARTIHEEDEELPLELSTEVSDLDSIPEKGRAVTEEVDEDQQQQEAAKINKNIGKKASVKHKAASSHLKLANAIEKSKKEGLSAYQALQKIGCIFTINEKFDVILDIQ